MKFNFALNKFVEQTINPNSIAIAGSNRNINWSEVEHFITEVNSLLISVDNYINNPVIIYGHKEAEFVLAIMACIKLNITYIPIDTLYPTDRVNDIINQTNSSILFNCTNEVLNLSVKNIFNILEPSFVKKRETVISNKIEDDFVQYILFTSGTTGNPKGVSILRSSLNNYANWCNHFFDFNSNSVFLNQAPFTFDVSLSDIVCSFSFGGSLILFDRDIQKNPQKFIERLKLYNCSVWTSTPSFIYIFLRWKEFRKETLEHLQTFIFMGEALNKNICKQLLQKFENCRIFNGYGPTEATIITSIYEITKNNIDFYDTIPIGREIQGSKLFLSKPNESEGELIISGSHVSIGYLNKPELNKQKFFEENGQRCFRTGDWAVFENGLFFCKGRIDSQIKFHGFRIELDEITSVIKSYQKIDDATTVALKNNGEVKRIISFINSQYIIEKDELTIYLKSKLPYYMIPSEWIFVSDFYYNSNGKVDSKKMEELYKQGYFQ